MSIYRITELERRVSNILRVGKISSVDYAAARCRVSIGELLTDPLPFIASRAGEDRTWHPPTVGEQVVVLSPFGELNVGIVLTGIYSSAGTAPATDENLDQTTYSDGTTVKYDRALHSLTIDLPTASSAVSLTVNGNATISVTGNALVEADGNATVSAGSVARIEAGSQIQMVAPAVSITSTVTVSGDVTAGGISLKTHRHGGVQGGSSQTSTPV